jgi:hypothetical protein
MHPPLDQWDAAYVQSIATPDESAELEKKASDKFDHTSNAKKNETSAELAKQVCAFSNSSRGFLVYGITKAGPLDGGVREIPSGNQTAKAWVEQVIPQQVQPPVHGCRAKHIPVPGHHAAGYRVLVVEIPLSQRRPHWVVEKGQEVAYIRAGEHSGRMSLQTFLDIRTRGDRAEVAIESLGVQRMKQREFQGANVWFFEFNPLVRLVAGPMCEHWAFQLRLHKDLGEFLSPHPANARLIQANLMTLAGCEPLFPGFPSHVGESCIRMHLKGIYPITATLCAGSSRSVTRTFSTTELMAPPIEVQGQSTPTRTGAITLTARPTGRARRFVPAQRGVVGYPGRRRGRAVGPEVTTGGLALLERAIFHLSIIGHLKKAGPAPLPAGRMNSRLVTSATCRVVYCRPGAIRERYLPSFSPEGRRT